MRKILLTAAFGLVLMGGAAAQAPKTKVKPIRFETKHHYVLESNIELTYMETWFSPIPMSTYRMEDGTLVSVKDFYMLKVEVPNMMYKLFIDDLKAKGKTDDLKLAFPDTNIWAKVDKNLCSTYFQNPSHHSFPVMGVSRQGVTMFCHWLNEQVPKLKLKKWAGKKVEFRLPTEVEWMVAAAGGDSNAVFAWKGTDMQMQQGDWGGDYMANFRRVGDADIVRGADGKLTVSRNDNKKYRSHFNRSSSTPFSAEITAPVLNYWPNAYGLFCMTGNVREMVQEEGFTKGGGWYDPGGECMIDFRNTYKMEGYPCEGFRIVAIVN